MYHRILFILLLFYYYINTIYTILYILLLYISIIISTLLQDCREPWFFLQFLFFGKKTHGEKVRGTNGRAGRRPRRMGSWEEVMYRDHDLRVRFHRITCKCEITIAVKPLFKLEIWKMLEKPCLFINYYQVILELLKI